MVGKRVNEMLAGDVESRAIVDKESNPDVEISRSVVANDGESLSIGSAVFHDRPIRGPHEPLGSERVIEPLHVLLRIQPGVGLL